MADNRPNIPNNIKIQVWTEAAGRCQFNNCNKPLWYNELTLNKTNFSQLAHIIGASKDGPRGGEDSNKLAKEANNLMLVCARCHKEIDDSITRGDYSIERLKKMKEEHSTRVRMLLDQPGRKTRPLIFTTQIGGQESAFSFRSIQKAILPDYPDKIEENWYRINTGSFDRENVKSWEILTNEIDNTLGELIRACSNGNINHVSIFGLAPQPLLMYLGRSIGDKISCQIFEPRRTEDQDKSWAWDEENGESISFKTSLIKKGSSKDVILLIALSDYLESDKYSSLEFEKPYIYQISIENPVQGFLKRKSDTNSFKLIARSFLNKIQKDVGKDCKIHVVSAMPASLAVEFGRLLQPTKDPEIVVYEYISGQLTRALNLIKK